MHILFDFFFLIGILYDDVNMLGVWIMKQMLSVSPHF